MTFSQELELFWENSLMQKDVTRRQNFEFYELKFEKVFLI